MTGKPLSSKERLYWSLAAFILIMAMQMTRSSGLVIIDIPLVPTNLDGAATIFGLFLVMWAAFGLARK